MSSVIQLRAGREGEELELAAWQYRGNTISWSHIVWYDLLCHRDLKCLGPSVAAWRACALQAPDQAPFRPLKTPPLAWSEQPRLLCLPEPQPQQAILHKVPLFPSATLVHAQAAGSHLADCFNRHLLNPDKVQTTKFKRLQAWLVLLLSNSERKSGGQALRGSWQMTRAVCYLSASVQPVTWHFK